MKANMAELYCSHNRVVLSGNNIRNARFKEAYMYRGCVISVPVIAYKDWHIQYDFKDEDEEKCRCDEIKKDWPYHSDVEKVR